MLSIASPDYPMLYPAVYPMTSQVELVDSKERLKPLYPIAIPPSKLATADTQKFKGEVHNLLPQIVPAAKTMAEKVATHNSLLKIYFLQISMHLEPRWRDRIFGQLDRLLDPEDWNEDEALPNFASYNTLLRFVLFVRPNRVPGLGLSNEGNLVASWSDKSDHLTIECLPQDHMQWSLLIETQGAPRCAAGSGNIERINDELAAFKPERWFQG